MKKIVIAIRDGSIDWIASLSKSQSVEIRDYDVSDIFHDAVHIDANNEPFFISEIDRVLNAPKVLSDDLAQKVKQRFQEESPSE